jgi:hypothetical protein
METCWVYENGKGVFETVMTKFTDDTVVVAYHEGQILNKECTLGY